MATINTQRRQLIRQVVLQGTGTTLDVTINLWERLALEIAAIIGDNGFQSLYSRSLHLVGETYPWLAFEHPRHPNESRFAGLKSNLAGRDHAEASEASIALLTTFLDILATLIGELMIASILRSAWGENTMDLAAKESGK